MSHSCRNILIRSVAAVAGDVAVGVAVAVACAWIIETAVLGLFLSFMLWLLGAMLALALSQYVVHPTLSALLSDHKLDAAVETVTRLASRLGWVTQLADAWRPTASSH